MKKLALFTMLATIATTGYAAVITEKAVTEKALLDEKVLTELQALTTQEKLRAELTETDKIIEKIEVSAKTRDQKVCLSEKKSNCLKNVKKLKNGKIQKEHLLAKGENMRCILKANHQCKVKIDPKDDQAAQSKVALLEQLAELQEIANSQKVQIEEAKKMLEECTTKVAIIEKTAAEEAKKAMEKEIASYKEKIAYLEKELAAATADAKMTEEEAAKLAEEKALAEKLALEKAALEKAALEKEATLQK